MENQYVEIGTFEMQEVLVETPDLEWSTTEEQCVTEQLSFPKLDGVLFPVVVANADVVAPCRWMDNAEVSLTTALNNYYQLMTEENADVVIADVYEFLANRIDKADKDWKEIEAQARAIELINVVSDKRATDKIHTIQIDANKKTEVTTQKTVQAQQKLVENPTATPVVYPVKKDVVPKAKTTTKTMREQNDRASNSMRHSTVVSEDLPSEPQLLEDAIEARIDLVSAPVLTVDQELTADCNHFVHAAPSDMIQQEVSESNLKNIEAVSYQSDGFCLEMPTEGADNPYDSPVLTDERHGFAKEKIELTTRVSQMEDYEIEKWPEAFGQEEDGRDFDEEHERTDMRGISRIRATGHDMETAETRLEADDIELSTQASLVAEEMNRLLINLSQHVEVSEPEIHEAAHELADVISGMSLKQEAEESVTGEVEFQEELKIFYTRFFEGTEFTSKTELVNLLIYLTVELQRESRETGSLGKNKEPDSLVTRSITPKQIKRLSAIAATLKKTLMRVITMGRFALRLNIINTVA